ncbi:MAG: hypothetical protein HZB68_03770 [Candidatus Aenigmarchaeota archaeon]|nr:hypothetical protein [Candidatus Aenigmarchaeota archaeon]
MEKTFSYILGKENGEENYQGEIEVTVGKSRISKPKVEKFGFQILERGKCSYTVDEFSSGDYIKITKKVTDDTFSGVQKTLRSFGVNLSEDENNPSVVRLTGVKHFYADSYEGKINNMIFGQLESNGCNIDETVLVLRSGSEWKAINYKIDDCSHKIRGFSYRYPDAEALLKKSGNHFLLEKYKQRALEDFDESIKSPPYDKNAAFRLTGGLMS